VSTPHELPAPRPLIAPHSADFWAATAENGLLGHCHAAIMVLASDPVVAARAAVERPAYEKRLAQARFTRTRSCGSGGAIALGGEAYKDAVPLLLAYVELTEGPTC